MYKKSDCHFSVSFGFQGVLAMPNPPDCELGWIRDGSQGELRIRPAFHPTSSPRKAEAPRGHGVAGALALNKGEKQLRLRLRFDAPADDDRRFSQRQGDDAVHRDKRLHIRAGLARVRGRGEHQ